MKFYQNTLAPSQVSTTREGVEHEVRLARSDGSEAATDGLRRNYMLFLVRIISTAELLAKRKAPGLSTVTTTD